jgi:glycosyltransferase involved in cell wall biosynthesis
MSLTHPDQNDLFVVVPFYNEEQWLPATLASLAAQSDLAFTLVLVDNASTDRSSAIALDFARAHPELAVDRIYEPQKGTGAASDTGFRYAIARGAKRIARTDADCLPDRDWVRNVRRAFDERRLEFVAGKIRPRRDESFTTWCDRLVLPFLIWVAEHYGRVAWRGPEFKYPYILAPGNNLAITAELYLAAGGFPRTSIAERHEDGALSEMVRTMTTRAALCRDVIVYNSARRVRAWGYLNTLRWYRNHGYQPVQVDIR